MSRPYVIYDTRNEFHLWQIGYINYKFMVGVKSRRERYRYGCNRKILVDDDFKLNSAFIGYLYPFFILTKKQTPFDKGV